MRFAAVAAVLHGALGLPNRLAVQVPPVHPVDTLPWNAAAGRLGSVRLGFAFLYDVDSYRQTRSNEKQVGELVPIGTVRTARLILDGTLGSGRRAWRYLAAVEPNRLENIDPPELTVKDLALSIPTGGNVWISVGRQKEGASQDILLGTRTQPYSERSAAVTEFLPTRNDGVRLWHSGPFTNDGRWGWSLGAFDSFLFNGNSFRANGGQYAARVFAAPIANDKTGRVAQLAFDIRVTGAQDGSIQFKSKPEVDAAPNFVDTGKIPASSATTLDVEALFQRRPLAFVAELLPTFVAGTPNGTLDFVGWYAGASWRSAGDARIYDRESGSLGRLDVERRRFVCEVAARITSADLTDASTDGGALERGTVAVAVYAPHDLRALLDYGFMTLSKEGIGRASSLTMRLQWELR
jgi:phosphate-selective porin